jgi:hypothetical protein
VAIVVRGLNFGEERNGAVKSVSPPIVAISGTWDLGLVLTVQPLTVQPLTVHSLQCRLACFATAFNTGFGNDREEKSGAQSAGWALTS